VPNIYANIYWPIKQLPTAIQQWQFLVIYQCRLIKGWSTVVVVFSIIEERESVCVCMCVSAIGLTELVAPDNYPLDPTNETEERQNWTAEPRCFSGGFPLGCIQQVRKGFVVGLSGALNTWMLGEPQFESAVACRTRGFWITVLPMGGRDGRPKLQCPVLATMVGFPLKTPPLQTK
jgi:hypothetical protein